MVKKKEEQMNKFHVDEFLEKRDDGTWITLKSLKALCKAFKEQRGFKWRDTIIVYDDEDGIDYSEASRLLKEEVEQLLGEEPDLPLECDECKNTEHFQVFVSRFYLDMEKGGKGVKDLRLENEGIITKPDSIVFVCSECKKIVLDSVIY